jgi:hypothetical protein
VLRLPDLGLLGFGTPYPLRNLLLGSCILIVSHLGVQIEVSDESQRDNDGRGIEDWGQGTGKLEVREEKEQEEKDIPKVIPAKHRLPTIFPLE